MKSNFASRAIAEFAGTAALVCVVVGSGIMAENLTKDAGLQLFINTFSIILALGLLIWLIAPISGAHFNPVVSLVQLATRQLSTASSLSYVATQIAGGIAGAILANAMFNLAALQVSNHARVTPGTLLGEVIATAGLIVLIGTLTHRGEQAKAPVAVAAWIGSAIFFTSSTSFANPAVTIGRVFSDTYTGIAPGSVLPFITAQLAGALLGLAISKGINRV